MLIARIISVPLCLSVMLSAIIALADEGYAYEKRQVHGNVLHIVTIDPAQYAAQLVKAENSRQPVDVMAAQVQGDIAINGGFFEIGNNMDGKPSGTLVIHGAVYGLSKAMQPLLIINKGAVQVAYSTPQKYLSKNASILSGIPLLLYDGKIADAITSKTGDFYTKAHARTAIGVTKTEKIVLLVAEHQYSRDIMGVTMGEVSSLMTQKGQEFAQKYHKKSPGDITITELKMILKDQFVVPGGAKGITIAELAHLMQELGCKDAINLDGGGSSTLWIKGKILNHTVGDSDEGNGLATVRPVSDAVIFKKR